jgi:hypothetical protein
MHRDRLRTTESPDGRKVATWRLRHRDCQILHIQNRADASTAHRWPSGAPLPAAMPGLVILDGLPTLWEARDAFPGHVDLWDAVRADYWAALLSMTDIPTPSTGM